MATFHTQTTTQQAILSNDTPPRPEWEEYIHGRHLQVKMTWKEGFTIACASLVLKAKRALPSLPF